MPPWSGDFFNTPYYYVMLLLALLGLAVSWGIRRSKFGLGLLAIRDDEDKALAVGVPARRYKLGAFVVSAVLVGMIGAVYGYYVTYIYPQFVIDPLVGLSMVLMVFLGELGNPVGTRGGSLSILEPAQLWLAYNFGASPSLLVFYAAVFLVVIILCRAASCRRWRTSSSVGATGPRPAHPERRGTHDVQPGLGVQPP